MTAHDERIARMNKDTATTPYEKLIVEFAETVYESIEVFVNLSKATHSTTEVMNAINYGLLAVTGRTLQRIADMLSDQTDRKTFCNDNRAIFEKYMREIEQGKRKDD